MVSRLLFLLYVGWQPIADAVDLFKVRPLVDRQLLEIAVAAAELSTCPFVCRPVDVIVLVTIADDHVVRLLQLL